MNSEALASIFDTHRMPPSPIDQYLSGGRDVLKGKFESFNEGVIRFFMLGYPFKSGNHVHKTLSAKPDLAEEVSISNFQRFAERMKAIHPAGIEINVISDGYAFNDVWGIPDEDTALYHDMVREMAGGTAVKFHQLSDFYPGRSMAEARDLVTQHHGITDTELERRILTEPNTTLLYRGMIRFLEEETKNRVFKSKNQHHVTAKRLARESMHRNEAYSNMMAAEFGSRAIRLSMHPTTNHTLKYSFQMIPSPKAWTSPWHCALLLDTDGEYATIHKADAEAAGHHLVERHGRPYFYEASK